MSGSARRGDDRGQALVVAVILLGLAAAAIVGIGEAQSRIIAAARDERAGEAAVAAAGAFVAGRAFELQRSLGRMPTPAEVTRFARAPDIAEGAIAAARDILGLNGAADPGDVEIRTFAHEIEVDLLVDGRRHRALLDLFGSLREPP